ncbi:hypothetical protein NDU88_003248 [Pleurodeles waltl]|uniref:Uncharacterized protein n=1 Tax=Pleurodeles waltl TaxID=8319 RepID=A0AAV7VGW8_PLEWA|nr:hypothetical protein NDU88_003248 [Pleurodeles waltl]
MLLQERGRSQASLSSEEQIGGSADVVTRVSEVQPSTSQGAGVGWADWEELLDYDEDLEEPVVSTKRVMVAEEVSGVVQGGHVPVRAAGNLQRGEESVVEFLRAQRGWGNVGAVGRARAMKGMVVGELGSKVDASIQVVRVGRAFCRRLGFAMQGAVLSHHHIRLRAGVKEDLRMWIGFLKDFNGVTMLVDDEDWFW